MKKLTVLTLVLILAGMFSLTAQNKLQINAAAAEQTEELRKQIKFSDEQRDQVYEICKEYQAAYQTLSVDLQANKEWKTKIDARLSEKLSTILTEEQFAMYQKLNEEDQ
jgi:hypothetical protein